MSYFNVRVYGLVINANDELLLSDEQEKGRNFTKFPGGGLELGEGLVDALKREFIEECNAKIVVHSHFYTTDFYEQSSFNDSQIISIYYIVQVLEPLQVPIKTVAFDFEEGIKQSFRWVSLNMIEETDVTFKTDRVVVGLLKKQYDESNR